MSQAALSVARNLQKSGAPTQRRSDRRRPCAKRGAFGARIWRGGLRISADSEPRRGPFGPAGEMGPRAPGLEVEARANLCGAVEGFGR
eukprot:9489801-Alexandrium_andersonii.AAC.1